MEKPNYWAVIPAHIRYAENLPANAKLLYAEISSLTNAAGYCFATNAYFENLYTLSERTIIRLLKALEKEGYIRIEDAEGGKAQRRIYAGINPLHSPPDKNVSTPLTKMSVPPDKNVTHNKKYNISHITLGHKTEGFCIYLPCHHIPLYNSYYRNIIYDIDSPAKT